MLGIDDLTFYEPILIFFYYQTNYNPYTNDIINELRKRRLDFLCIINQEDGLKARCTPEKLTILTKHSKTFFFYHVVKNIVNYQLQKFYVK